MNGSRRDFLKVAGLSVFAAGTAATVGALTKDAEAVQLVTPGEGSHEATRNGLEAHRWAMVIDTRKFKTAEDFRRVINACHREHNVPEITGKQEIKWIWTDKYNHVFPDDMNAFLPKKFLDGDFLLMCNHCENPPCVRVCPTGATFKRADGIVGMDPHRCIGCRFCMAGCPYGARSFNFRDPQPFVKDVNPEYPMRMRGVVEKCTFCEERLSKGKLPACVEASNGAMIFGDLNDPESEVRKVLAENYSIRRKPSLGTQPGVYYII